MILTSSDILNVVLAVCITVLTFFLCLAIYYFLASVQRINKITKKIEGGVTKAEELVTMAKDKLKNSPAYFMIFTELAKKAMEFIQEKRGQRRETVKKNKKK